MIVESLKIFGKITKLFVSVNLNVAILAMVNRNQTEENEILVVFQILTTKPVLLII